MEKRKILLDNNGIDEIFKNFNQIYSIKDKCEFYICQTVYEEFINTIDLLNKNDRFILDKSIKSKYYNLSIEEILLILANIDNEEDLFKEITKFDKCKLQEKLKEFLIRKKEFKSKLQLLMKLEPKIILDGIFVLGYSKLGTARFGSGEVFYKLEKRTCKNLKDTIIAETSVNSNCDLLTNDICLLDRMEKAGYKTKTISIEELLGLYSES